MSGTDETLVQNRPRITSHFYDGAYRCGFAERGTFIPIGCEHKSAAGVTDHAEWFAQRNRPRDA